MDKSTGVQFTELFTKAYTALQEQKNKSADNDVVLTQAMLKKAIMDNQSEIHAGMEQLAILMNRIQPGSATFEKDDNQDDDRFELQINGEQINLADLAKSILNAAIPSTATIRSKRSKLLEEKQKLQADIVDLSIRLAKVQSELDEMDSVTNQEN